jgi:hypothetical protein
VDRTVEATAFAACPPNLLTPTEKAIARACRVDALSLRQAGPVLGLSDSAVCAGLTRARNKLNAWLARRVTGAGEGSTTVPQACQNASVGLSRAQRRTW